MRIICILIVAFLVFNSCGSDNNKPANVLNYFPIRVGQAWVYEVEETTITRAACTDDGTTTMKYDLQVKVTDSVPATDQGFAYRLQLSKRKQPTDAWVPSDVWIAQITGNKVVVNESNISFVKLVLPTTENLSWNGNLFNSRLELNGQNVDNYKATNVGQPYTNPWGLSFDKSISVVQHDEQNNIIYRDSRLEVYANQVGLVYKEAYLLSYFANSQLPCYGQKRTQQGTIYKQSLKQFSN